MTSSTYFGNVGAEVAGIADDGIGNFSGGVLSLSTIPAGATILEATLYSMDVGSPDTQNALFDAVNLVLARKSIQTDCFR